jgi:hypothetical protein
VSTSSTSPTTGTQTTSATPLFNVGGIATGLDTNSIINELLSIEPRRVPGQVALGYYKTGRRSRACLPIRQYHAAGYPVP